MDDDLVSERINRAVKAFQVDDYDDEFTISGTGQILGLGRSITHNDQEEGPFIYSSTPLWKGIEPHESVAASDSNNFNQLFYLYLAGAAIAGAVLYHIVIRWLTTSPSNRLHTRTTNSRDPLDSTQRVDAAAVNTTSSLVVGESTTPIEYCPPLRVDTETQHDQQHETLDDVPDLAMEDDACVLATAAHARTVADISPENKKATLMFQQSNKEMTMLCMKLLLSGQ